MTLEDAHETGIRVLALAPLVEVDVDGPFPIVDLATPRGVFEQVQRPPGTESPVALRRRRRPHFDASLQQRRG
jgi:hypothetical protein